MKQIVGKFLGHLVQEATYAYKLAYLSYEATV
jgi:hypothetical protein